MQVNGVWDIFALEFARGICFWTLRLRFGALAGAPDDDKGDDDGEDYGSQDRWRHRGLDDLHEVAARRQSCAGKSIGR